MYFSDIQGYWSVKQRLIHVVQTHQVPHAQLFWGPEGNAGLPLALAFITYLNCLHRLEDDACGQCTSCLRMKKLVHPNVKFVFPTSATKQITGKDAISTSFLKTWRTFVSECPYGHPGDWSRYLDDEKKQLSISKEEARAIIQAVSFKAFEGEHKVVLIWLPEYFHMATANALLKVIEEPPLCTLFLLVSIRLDKVLDTICSRTQQIHIPPFTDKALSNMLSKKHPLSQKQLGQVALLADGNLNKAFKLVANMQGVYFDHFKNWMRLCYSHNLTQLISQADAFQEMRKADQKNFLTYSLHMLRAVLISCFTQVELTRATDEELEFVQKLRQFLTYQQIKEWIIWLNQAHNSIERHVNSRILYLDLSLRITHTFRP